MLSRERPSLYIATTENDALAALADLGAAGAPLAGATWIMRAPIRQERLDASYVSVGKIDGLRRLAVDGQEISIGACMTHADLTASLASSADYRGLVNASGSAANPAIRQVATIGGNICATGFPASDLVPALLCLDADVELVRQSGEERIPLERFLQMRAFLEPGYLLRRVIVARKRGRCAHARLPLRKAGDYPVAIVSLAAALNENGTIEDIRVAVGSVEPLARRWTSLETELVGCQLDPDQAAEKAVAYSADFQGRDGVEAPGWYRVKVLPSLVRRAMQALRDQS